jgi:hypothetical protein
MVSEYVTVSTTVSNDHETLRKIHEFFNERTQRIQQSNCHAITTSANTVTKKYNTVGKNKLVANKFRLPNSFLVYERVADASNYKQPTELFRVIVSENGASVG